MRRALVAIVLLGLAAAACSAPAGEGSTTTALGTPTGEDNPGGVVSGVAGAFDPASVRFVAALQRFDSCDALLSYFKSEALARVGPYGLGGGPIYYTDGMRMPAARESDGEMTVTTAAATTIAAGTGNGDYSGTNVQVAGVDEPDTVKTDGSRILTIMNGTLYYVVVEGSGGRLAGSLPLSGGWDHRFFMSGDRALVFSQGDYAAVPLVESAARIMPNWNGPITLVQEVDLSDPAHMRIVRTMRIEGGYLSARAIGSTVRLVISSYPSDLPFVYPSGPAAEDLALATNKTVIEQSTLEDWLPSYTLLAGEEVMEQGFLADCAQTHRPAEFAGFDTLSVVTLSLDGSLDPSSAAASAVIADGETVYASSERLYVATNVWVPSELIGDPRLDVIEEDYSTAIHAFDITGDGPARYLASGSVDGHLLNQFSMDEYEGHLRVATTDGSPWSATNASESGVSVLAMDGNSLVEVGRVGDLGRGESIYSVRFVGPTAYVVTFRQTDPLYVVDLRDPAAPRVSGELEITGYSAYLHPLDEGRLLGVGQEATAEGMTTGAKVTLFDVSDPANPRTIDSWSLAQGYSDVEYDHLAFLYWAPEQIVVMPVQEWSSNFVGAVVLKTDDGVREVGRITHELDETTGASDCRQIEVGTGKELIVQVCGPDDRGGAGGYYCEVTPDEGADDLLAGYGLGPVEIGADERLEICWPNYYGPVQITRSLVIGQTLWTLSWLGLQANALDGLAITAEVPLG